MAGSITLLNCGRDKPQQGITPTDYRQNRPVTIQALVPIKTARDLLSADEPLTVENGGVRCEVLAGGVRIIELE